jgi:putative MATE family efflux protein
MATMGLLKVGYFLADSFWVGRMGDDALTALAGTTFAWWMILLLGELGAMGTHSLVARAEGAGARDRVAWTAGQGLWVAGAATLVCLALVPVAGLYFEAIDLHGVHRELGRAYLDACLLGASTMAVHAVVGGVFRGLGDTRTALRITALTLVANAALDPVGIAWMGIAGAAWATAASNALGVVLGLWVLSRRGLRVRLSRPDPQALWSIVQIGAPVSARGIAFSAVYVVLARMITTFGDPELAAIGIGHRLEGLGYMVCVGFEMATATMVGQHLGAGSPDGARRSVVAALQVCTALVVPTAAGLWFLAEPLFGLFANEPATIAAGVVYLRVQVWAAPFMVLESVVAGAFAGTGRTTTPFLVGATGNLLRLPVAFVLAFVLPLGVVGIWWAIAASTALKGIVVTALWWREGLVRHG